MARDISARTADPMVLAAMMDDLGVHRIEELVRDDVRGHPCGSTPSARATSTITRSIQPRNGGTYSNELSEAYHAAIKDGYFDDDDAAGVNNLDPLDNGNAHRVGRATYQPLGHLRHDNQARNEAKTLSRRPTYDPSQPTHWRGRSKRSAPTENHHMSSLGGVIPDGGQVKRWDGGRPTDPGRPNELITDRPIGCEDPVPGQEGSSSGTGGGHRRGVFPVDLPPTVKIGQEVPTKQPRKELDRGAYKQAQPQQSPTNVSQRVNTDTGSASRTIRDITSDTPKAGHSSNDATSWIPPHLRKVSGSQLDSSGLSLGPNSMSAERSKASSGPSSILSKASEGVLNLNQDIDRITSLDAKETFFHGKVLVSQHHSELVSGQIVLYEPLGDPVGIWELSIGDSVTRGDVRGLLEALTNGSTAYLRRYNGVGRVRSDCLRFSNIGEATNFANELNFRRDQYSGSSAKIHIETTVRLTENPNAIINGMNSTGSSIREPHIASLKLPQPEQLGTGKSNPEPAKLVELATEHNQNEVVSQSLASPISLSSVEMQSTLANVTNRHPELIELGESENDLIDLITFDPDPVDKPSRSDELIGVYDEQFVVTQGCATREARDSGESQFEQPGVQRAQRKRRGTDAAEEVMRALRDMKIINEPVTNNQPGEACHLWRTSADYKAVIRMSKLLTIAFEDSPTPHPNLVFVASLLHMVETDGFLDLSRDDQKKHLIALYTTVCRSGPRITRSRMEISALRSGDEACPNAIREFNALVKNWKSGRFADGMGIPHPPFYGAGIVVESERANSAFSYGRSTGDLLGEGTREGITITNPPPVSKRPTSRESLEMSDEIVKGLMQSRWAEDKPEDIRKQPGENYATPDLFGRLDLGGIRDTIERGMGGNVNSHHRSLTRDTITSLADQLGSLSVDCEYTL